MPARLHAVVHTVLHLLFYRPTEKHAYHQVGDLLHGSPPVVAQHEALEVLARVRAAERLGGFCCCTLTDAVIRLLTRSRLREVLQANQAQCGVSGACAN